MKHLAKQLIGLRWREVLAVAKVASEDPQRMDLWGVRVSVRPFTGAEEWPVVMVATDGRRLAALETTARAERVWPAGMPTEFTIPLSVIKRVKKPGKGAREAWAAVAFDFVEVEEKPSKMEAKDAEGNVVTIAEVTTKIEIQNLMVWGSWDGLRIQQDAVPQKYPEWRRLMPEVPHVPAQDVKVRGGQVAGFSEALELLGAEPTVALFRSAHRLRDEESVMVVRGQRENFFGLLMPVRGEIPSLTELPLWLEAADALLDPEVEGDFFEKESEVIEEVEEAETGDPE